VSVIVLAAVIAAAPGGVKLIAFDLPGFGLSDAFDYTGRSLRGHAVAQLRSLLDALGLERVPVIGTSLGGMWAFCLAVDAPERITSPRVRRPGGRTRSRPNKSRALWSGKGDARRTTRRPGR
jgi:pimeloyl-ACP methyl ester carboxylesterase